MIFKVSSFYYRPAPKNTGHPFYDAYIYLFSIFTVSYESGNQYFDFTNAQNFLTN
jgi:hypothetical protein